MKRTILSLFLLAFAAGCATAPVRDSSSAAAAQNIVILAPAEGAVEPLLSEGQKAFFDLSA